MINARTAYIPLILATSLIFGCATPKSTPNRFETPRLDAGIEKMRLYNAGLNKRRLKGMAEATDRLNETTGKNYKLGKDEDGTPTIGREE